MMRCRHDGIGLVAATVEFSPTLHVVLEFTLKVGRVAAGTLVVDSANINPMTAPPEYVKALNDTLTGFKSAMEDIFVRHGGVLQSEHLMAEEGSEPVEL